MKDDIQFFDAKRWLFGDAPPEFLIEVVFRTLIIYLFLLLVVRMLGKRMTGQITLTELAVVITLGAIVSPVMQMPDKGIIYGLIALATAWAFHKGFTYLSVKSSKIEKLTQGNVSLIISDGEINMEELERLRISKQQLMALLRQKKITNLGTVKRAYWEACGLLSIYKYPKAKPGMSTFPESDKSIFKIQMTVNSGMRTCATCGHTQNSSEGNICKHCKEDCWTVSYLIKEQ